MGRRNISPRGSGDLDPKPELLPLPSEPLGTAASPVTEGPPLSKKVPPRPLVDFLEEEAINGEQGREEEEKKEKEKEEEEEEMEIVCAECVIYFSKKMRND